MATTPPSSYEHWQLQGLVGSLDAPWVATAYQQTAAARLRIAHDPEEAAYLYNDLKNLLAGYWARPGREVEQKRQP